MNDIHEPPVRLLRDWWARSDGAHCKKYSHIKYSNLAKYFIISSMNRSFFYF